MDPLRWRIAVAIWPSRYQIVDDAQGGRALVTEDLEGWLWKRLPYRLFMIIANIHDTLPWGKGVWTDDDYGNVR
jgi:hypothetical protein